MIEAKDLPAVVSRQRSGTHWLCSLIYQWFYAGELTDQRIPNAILPFKTWNSDDAPAYPWAGLLGGHINSPDSGMAKALAPRKIIYLFRSARNSLPSMWRLRTAEAQIKGWPRYTFPQYLRMRPPVTDDGNTYPPGLNVRDLCEWSQNRWIESAVFVVRYGDMVADIGSVRDRLAKFLGLKPKPLYYASTIRVGFIVPQGQHTNDELWETVT